jgi:hypothetical protein
VASGVYAIVNTVTGECFVGSSADMRLALAVHRSSLRDGLSEHRALQEAWTQYGEQAFTFLVLEEVADVATLKAREQYFTDVYSAIALGYNTPPSEAHAPEAPAPPAVSVSISVMIPDALIARMRKLTEQRGVTVAAFVQQAITEKLEREGA